MRGQYLEPVDDDLKEKFLDMIANGYTRPEAAQALGTNARVMRSLCNPQSHRYDEDFHRRYSKLTEKDGEHHAALVERLRAAGIERAIRSSDRLLEKYSVVYDPDWHVHRPQGLQINVSVDQLRAEFAQLPDEALQAYVEQLKQKQAAELEAGDVIDADATEL